MKNIFSLATILGILFSIAASAQEATPADVVVLEKAELAVSARVAVIMNAKTSIDALYFAMDNDSMSLKALALLRDAAQRGVRVRLIVDSMHNELTRLNMAAVMDTLTPEKRANFEIREFNQFNLFKASCYHRRMHDKSLIVDGQYLVVGDRNIANGYFDLKALDRNGLPMPVYQGMDVLISGDKVIQSSKNYFMDRWNSKDVKVPQLYEYSRDRLHPDHCRYTQMDHMDRCLMDRQATTKRIRSAQQRIDQELESILQKFPRTNSKDLLSGIMSLAVTSPHVEFIHDDVNEKPFCKGKPQANIGQRIYDIIDASAEESVIVVTPYLVVTPEMEALVQKLSARGVEVRFITNSSQSNDVPAAQEGFRKTRSKLFNAGAKVFEFNDVSEELGEIETLHAKMILIDNKKFFIGSYNWDYRSQNINSEVGVMMDVPVDESTILLDLIKAGMSEVAKSAQQIDSKGNKIGPRPKRHQLTEEQREVVRAVIQQREESARLWRFLLNGPLGPWILTLL